MAFTYFQNITLADPSKITISIWAEVSTAAATAAATAQASIPIFEFGTVKLLGTTQHYYLVYAPEQDCTLTDTPVTSTFDGVTFHYPDALANLPEPERTNCTIQIHVGAPAFFHGVPVPGGISA